MARGDFYYVPLQEEMEQKLIYIAQKWGKKRGLKDKTTLARYVITKFIDDFESENGPIPIKRMDGGVT